MRLSVRVGFSCSRQIICQVHQITNKIIVVSEISSASLIDAEKLPRILCVEALKGPLQNDRFGCSVLALRKRHVYHVFINGFVSLVVIANLLGSAVIYLADIKRLALFSWNS